ncbi:MAG: hypothetical protein NTY77_05605 [Elusimicrobia bacterium]|nr:hypothetical protein [Elusimicrobiota bacterium]
MLNLNQQALAPVLGQLDLNIPNRGLVISGQISQNQATALKAGAFVKRDPAQVGGLPQYLEASASEDSEGALLGTSKEDTFAKGEPVSVGSVGSIVYLTAKTTLAPQAKVECNADGSMQAVDTGKQRGITFDPGVAGELFRVLITNPVA